MPAAAVIPAPTVYAKVVAVEKLVVGSWLGAAGPSQGVLLAALSPGFRFARSVLLTECRRWPMRLL